MKVEGLIPCQIPPNSFVFESWLRLKGPDIVRVNDTRFVSITYILNQLLMTVKVDNKNQNCGLYHL